MNPQEKKRLIKQIVSQCVDENKNGCEERFMTKEQHHKLNMGALKFFIVMAGAVIAWTYKPVSDIASMKTSITLLTEQVGILNKNITKSDTSDTAICNDIVRNP